MFGAGFEANAYYAAFRLPDALFSLIAGGALSSAMIPVLLSTSKEDGEDAAWKLTNLVLTVLVTVFALVVLLGELLAPAFVTHVLAPGFTGRTSSLTITLTRIMLLQPVILAVGSVATAILNSRNQFLLTAISVASHNIALIAGIEATRHHPSLGIVVVLAIPALLFLIGLGHPIIQVLFQHGKYDVGASSLTYDVLAPYAVALPAYVATEVLSRGLIAMRDTRTPLLTNSVQLAGRALLMALLLGSVGVRAIPIAFAVMATVEAVALAVVLLVKMQRRIQGTQRRPVIERP